jgi:hypothetical protein
LQTQTTHLISDNPADALVFLSDRQKGLIEAVDRLFPGSPHAYCLRHLYDNLHKQFKHSSLKTLLWEAARAGTESDFKRCMADIKALSPGCAAWLTQKEQDPSHWADLYFKGRRYGHLTSNIAEAFNAKLLIAREMPILAMLEEIRHQVMDWFASRRHKEDSTVGPLISDVACKILTTTERARRYRYRPSTDTLFEIQSKETLKEYIVNLDAHTCSCRLWQTDVSRTPKLSDLKGVPLWTCACCPFGPTQGDQHLRQAVFLC